LKKEKYAKLYFQVNHTGNLEAGFLHNSMTRMHNTSVLKDKKVFKNITFSIYKYNSCIGDKKHETTVCNYVHCSAISKYNSQRSVTSCLSVLAMVLGH